MARKTFAVEALRKRVANLLNQPGPYHLLQTRDMEGATTVQDVADRAFRLGAIHTLEHVLHATGNYKGFRYTVEPWQSDPTRRDYF